LLQPITPTELVTENTMGLLAEASYSEPAQIRNILRQALSWYDFFSSVLLILSTVNLAVLARAQTLPKLCPYLTQFAAIAISLGIAADVVSGHFAGQFLDELTKDLLITSENAYASHQYSPLIPDTEVDEVRFFYIRRGN
jgi:hypothetical protein